MNWFKELVARVENGKPIAAIFSPIMPRNKLYYLIFLVIKSPCSGLVSLNNIQLLSGRRRIIQSITVSIQWIKGIQSRFHPSIGKS